MKRLTLALLLAAAAPAAAQTARIAHASHGGRPETLVADAAADNFGILQPYFVADSIRFLTDTTALEYGKWEGHRVPEKKTGEKIRAVQFSGRKLTAEVSGFYSRAEYLAWRQHARHPVKLVGSDTTMDKNKVGQLQPVELKAKEKHRRKRAALTPPPAAPGGPPLPGSLLLAAGVLLLAGAGWLLAAAPDKRPLAPA